MRAAMPGVAFAEQAWQNGQAGTPDTKLGDGRLGCGEAPRPPEIDPEKLGLSSRR